MHASENVNKEREYLIQENERLKALTSEQEKDLNDVQSSYERDRALWENKFAFLEEQKEKSKGDLQEAQRKFDLTLESI